MGQILVKHPAKPGICPKRTLDSTPKPAGKRRFTAYTFVFYSICGNSPSLRSKHPKCKLLLHLGNSRAFFVDNKLSLSYDFSTGGCPEIDRCSSPSPRLNLWFSKWLLSKRIRVFPKRERPRAWRLRLPSGLLTAMSPARRTCCRNIRLCGSATSARNE